MVAESREARSGDIRSVDVKDFAYPGRVVGDHVTSGFTNCARNCARDNPTLPHCAHVQPIVTARKLLELLEFERSDGATHGTENPGVNGWIPHLPTTSLLSEPELQASEDFPCRILAYDLASILI